MSVPLVYPVLLYLLARMLLAGFRPRERPGRLVPHLPLTLLAVGLVFLVAFRIGLNVADSNVIDVGYAGVVGADRIVDGDQLYGEGFSEDVERGDTYGPLELPALRAVRAGVHLERGLGRPAGRPRGGDRLRPAGDRRACCCWAAGCARGGRGWALGLALAYAWAAYPYTTFVLESNSNDALVALACVGALLVSAPLGARRWCWVWARRPSSRLSRWRRCSLAGRRWCSPPRSWSRCVALTAPFVPDDGLRELYDRTLGYQLGRPSPFSVWGQAESLSWLHTAVKVGAAALALAVAFRPREPDARQLAALGAAVLIALELAATHWFYLYVVWFVPFVLVALFAAQRITPPEATAPAEPERELVPA